jgi:hypothetical protein
MQFQEKEQLINRVASRFLICKLGRETYRLYCPDKDSQYEASLIHDEVLEKAFYNGAMSQQQAVQLLIENNLWSAKLAEELETAKKNIDVLKIELYNYAYKSAETRTIRRAIQVTIDRVNELEAMKSKFDHLTAEGIASLAKTSFLICNNLFHLDKTPVKDVDNRLVEKVIGYCNKKALGEAVYRELARSEPWNSIYSAGKTGREVFDCCAVELTIEQRVLLFWTKVYHSIYESSECPHQSIIDDDWMLDGWLLKEAREREMNQKKASLEDQLGISAHVGKAAEIGVMVSSPEDAKNLMETMNSPEANARRRQRDKQIVEKGEVKEINLTDVRQDLMMKYNQLQHEQIKNKGK